MPHAGSPFGVVTVSIGWATARPDLDATVVESHGEALIEMADRRLYDAKAAGRCRVGGAENAALA